MEGWVAARWVLLTGWYVLAGPGPRRPVSQYPQPIDRSESVAPFVSCVQVFNPMLHVQTSGGVVSESFPDFGLNLRNSARPAKVLSHTAWAAQRA